MTAGVAGGWGVPLATGGEVQRRVPLGRAEVPEGCSFRALVSIDFLPFSRPKAVTSTENARIDAPHLKIFRP